MTDPAVADTRRLNSRPQDLTDAYGPPSNFLEIDVYDPQIVGVGRNRYTNYEVRMRTNLPIFKLKDSCVRRRYSDFEWLKNELERDSKIVVPSLPGKALKRQLPFRGDEGLFEESFIEERRSGLEQFINRIAGHPLAQNERCLHMFLQDESIDRNYIPGKVRHSGLRLLHLPHVHLFRHHVIIKLVEMSELISINGVGKTQLLFLDKTKRSNV
ncbi:sorting nexin-12 isoform X1 [Sebastes fasciatus]|uniref:sorting nexin-12 isoform X1 n=2 Tax=Sebastes TaxID=34820 RepID=UPI003D9E131E